MGLDMYLRGEKFKRTEFSDGGDTPITVQMVDGFERKSEILRLGYWRKHAPLHKLIVDTFADGVDECQVIHLSADDCRKIAQMLRQRELPAFHECDGFFFGKGDLWREYVAEADKDADLFERVAEWSDMDKDGGAYWHDVEYQASW